MYLSSGSLCVLAAALLSSPAPNCSQTRGPQLTISRPLHYLFVSMPVILRLSSIAQLAMQAAVFVPLIQHCSHATLCARQQRDQLPAHHLHPGHSVGPTAVACWALIKVMYSTASLDGVPLFPLLSCWICAAEQDQLGSHGVHCQHSSGTRGTSVEQSTADKAADAGCHGRQLVPEGS